MAKDIEEYKASLFRKKQGDLINELITLRLEGPPEDTKDRLFYYAKIDEVVSKLNLIPTSGNNGDTKNERTKSSGRPKVKSLKNVL